MHSTLFIFCFYIHEWIQSTVLRLMRTIIIYVQQHKVKKKLGLFVFEMSTFACAPFTRELYNTRYLYKYNLSFLYLFQDYVPFIYYYTCLINVLLTELYNYIAEKY